VFKIAAWRLAPSTAASGRRFCEVLLMHAALAGGQQLLVQHTVVLQVPPLPYLLGPLPASFCRCSQAPCLPPTRTSLLLDLAGPKCCNVIQSQPILSEFVCLARMH
jgi:hypothetical protein